MMSDDNMTPREAHKQRGMHRQRATKSGKSKRAYYNTRQQQKQQQQ